MGLCFSYQQNRDIERLTTLLTFGDILPGDAIQESSYEELNREQVEPIKTSKNKPVLEETFDPSHLAPQSFHVAADGLGTLSVSDEAKEERRRRREERRAARLASEEKLKIELNLKPSAEYLAEKTKLDVVTFKPVDDKKKCLVLDIDYTIFDHKSDFELAPEFRRPYLHEFLKACNDSYNIIIWSATAFFHVYTKLEKLQLLGHPDFQICSVLCKDHMIPHAFTVKRKTYVQDIKPLSLLWTKFPDTFNPSNTIHIDDISENFALNPKNGLRIDPFKDALSYRQSDKELFYLTQYLIMIASLPSFDHLDHSKWKDYIINTLWDLQTTFSLPTFSPPGPPSPILLEQHQQSILFKRALKEKAKDKEREERAKESEKLRSREADRERGRSEDAAKERTDTDEGRKSKAGKVGMILEQEQWYEWLLVDDKKTEQPRRSHQNYHNQSRNHDTHHNPSRNQDSHHNQARSPDRHNNYNHPTQNSYQSHKMSRHQDTHHRNLDHPQQNHTNHYQPYPYQHSNHHQAQQIPHSRPQEERQKERSRSRSQEWQRESDWPLQDLLMVLEPQRIAPPVVC